MSFGGNPTMKSGPPIQPGANAGIWSPPPQGTYTPSTAPTSVWTANPNAGVQTGIPQGGHAQGAIAQYLQGTSPTKLSYDSAAHDAWLNDALEKARKAGEVRYEEPKPQRRASAAVAPPRKKKPSVAEQLMQDRIKASENQSNDPPGYVSIRSKKRAENIARTGGEERKKPGAKPYTPPSEKVIKNLSGATMKGGLGIGAGFDGRNLAGPMNKGGLVKGGPIGRGNY
jgi:hypothetical protein